MKKIISIIGVLLLFNCSWFWLPDDCQATIEDCAKFVEQKIKYRDDKFMHNKDDYWQTYEETKKSMEGDCEDKCIYFAFIIKRNLGIDSDFYLVDNWTDYHFLVKADNKYWDVGSGSYYSVYDQLEDYAYPKWLLKLSYDDMMELAEKYHGYKKGYGEINSDL